ncbi:MAG: NosD domain-containing protein, partial [Candidatus Kariarchaeaceae archaeon]
DEPIYIWSNDDFINYGFPGSGTPDDPFLIEGYSITNPNDNLINIFDTDAYFVIRDTALNGLGSDWLWGINLYNVRNGVIENNFITGTGTAINLDHSMNNKIVNNYIDGNGGGVNLHESRENSIDGNTFTNNGWAAISLTNEQPIVWMRFWQDVTAT